METIVKEILSRFLKTDPSSVVPETVIDRSALGNSIMVHRLYASLAEKGINVSDYSRIRTYNDLRSLLQGNQQIVSQPDIQPQPSKDNRQVNGFQHNNISIGIDIEDKNNFQQVTDYRVDAFYTSNFSQAEISYCIMQNEPVISFTGLFAAKEAIVKADNQFRNRPFSSIEIMHNGEGKPYHQQFQLSISHAGSIAVAIAIPANSGSGDYKTTPQSLDTASSTAPIPSKVEGDNAGLGFKVLAILAFLLALFSTFLTLTNYFPE